MSMPFCCSLIYHGVRNAAIAKEIGPNGGKDARWLPKRYNDVLVSGMVLKTKRIIAFNVSGRNIVNVMPSLCSVFCLGP